MQQAVIFQRIEGLAILLASALAYGITNSSWLMFLVLLLAVDIFMAGYLVNNKLGAYVYNLGHSLTAPLALWALGYTFGIDLLVALSLIWTAHIGMDRAFGYGLKYEAGFHRTHLGEIGRK